MREPRNSLRHVLFIGDLHADDKTPRSRRDDYLEATVEELNEAIQIAFSNTVDAVVFLGDIFHRPDPGGRCRNAILRILADAKSRGIRLITVEGNHDTENAPHTLPHTALGTLIDAGVLERIPIMDNDLKIGFVHHYPGVEADLAAGSLSNVPGVSIWAVHAYVSTQPVRWEYVPFADLPLNPECHLVVAGHIHAQMQGVRADGVKFINPGSLCRNRMEEQMLTQMPHVLLVEYDAKGQTINGDGAYVKCDFIPLASSRPAREIFRIEEVSQRKDDQAETKRYLEKLRFVGQVVGSGDEYDRIRDSGQVKGVGTEVVSLVIATLRGVRNKTIVKKSK